MEKSKKTLKMDMTNDGKTDDERCKENLREMS